MSCTDGLDCWIPMLMGSAGAQRDLLDSIIQDRPVFVVRIMLEQESHTSSSLVPATISVRYQLDLRSLRDDPHHSDGGPVWDKFLDAIFPAQSLEYLRGESGIRLEGHTTLVNLLRDSVGDLRQLYSYWDPLSLALWRL